MITDVLNHLPAIIILLPFAAATFSIFITKSNFSYWFTLAVILLLNIISFSLYYQVIQNPIQTIAYVFGGWNRSVGIEYRLDLFCCYFLSLISILSLIIAVQLRQSILHHIKPDKYRIFCALFLFCLTGILGIIISNDLFNIYVFLEICSLSAYGLVAISKKDSSLLASFLYLIYGTIGACFILLAIGLLFMITGHLNITEISFILKNNNYPQIKLASLILFTIGLMLKMAIFPFHSWLAKLYQHSSSLVGGFLACTMPTMCFYLLCKLIIQLYNFNQIPSDYFQLLLAISFLTILIGSILACTTTKLKEIWGYSSVTNIGYCLLALSILDQYGFYLIIVIITNHAFIKLGLFFTSDQIEQVTENDDLNNLVNLGKHAPLQAGLLIFYTASLIGLPLTAGFINKWHLIQFTALNQFVGLGLILISSVLSLVYFIKIINYVYFAKNESVLVIRKNVTGNIGLILITILNIALAFPNLFLTPLINQIIETLP